MKIRREKWRPQSHLFDWDEAAKVRPVTVIRPLEAREKENRRRTHELIEDLLMEVDETPKEWDLDSLFSNEEIDRAVKHAHIRGGRLSENDPGAEARRSACAALYTSKQDA